MKVHPSNPNLIWVEKFGCGMWQDITHHKVVLLGKDQKLTVLRQTENIAGLGEKVVAYKPPAPIRRRNRKDLPRRMPRKYEQTPELQAAYRLVCSKIEKRSRIAATLRQATRGVASAKIKLKTALVKYWDNKQ